MTVCRDYILVEEHGQHHLVGLLGQVGQEEDLVGRLLRDAGRHGRGRSSCTHTSRHTIMVCLAI